MFTNNIYYQSSSSTSTTGPENKKQTSSSKIIAQNNNGKKKAIIQQSVNDKTITKHLNNNEIEQVFNHQIYENPFQIYNFSKPKLHNLNQNTSCFIPNSIGNTTLDLVDTKGSEMGYNYAQLSDNLKNFIDNQDNHKDPYYEKFFRYRGGNGL